MGRRKAGRLGLRPASSGRWEAALSHGRGGSKGQEPQSIGGMGNSDCPAGRQPQRPRRRSLSATPSGNCRLKAWSAMPASSRRAAWMCSGRTRMPFSRSQARVCGSSGHVELLLVGGADDAVALDAPAQEHDRADGPVVLAVAVVVGRRAAHLALDDDDQLVANLQRPRRGASGSGCRRGTRGSASSDRRRCSRGCRTGRCSGSRRRRRRP